MQNIFLYEVEFLQSTEPQRAAHVKNQISVECYVGNAKYH